MVLAHLPEPVRSSSRALLSPCVLVWLWPNSSSNPSCSRSRTFTKSRAPIRHFQILHESSVRCNVSYPGWSRGFGLWSRICSAISRSKSLEPHLSAAEASSLLSRARSIPSRLVLRRNIWRARPEHAILERVHRTRRSGPIVTNRCMDTTRTVRFHPEYKQMTPLELTLPAQMA